jgi:hypothetical protein
MADYPPFMNAYAALASILEKVKHAKTPDRFTYDFLETTLGFKSSGARAFIPLAKRLGLLNSDATPTDLYKSFRNEGQSGAAMAAAIRKGFTQLYERNEKANDLPKKDLEGLIVETTGLERASPTVRAIVGTFETLRSVADFKREIPGGGEGAETTEEEKPPDTGQRVPPPALNLAYTINLVLPKTDDVAVFNAIFKSLRDNLLRQ